MLEIIMYLFFFYFEMIKGVFPQKRNPLTSILFKSFSLLIDMSVESFYNLVNRF